MAIRRFVAYYRVSTAKQGRSGLGLEAQKEAVRQFLDGASSALCAEFEEQESGKRNDRHALAQALAACRVHRATLIIAKLDRLSRDAHFLLGLEKAGVDFVAVDMPSANRLTVGIMAMVADEERRMISARTKAALAAAKARGMRLGNPKGTGRTMTDDDRAKAAASVKAIAEAKASDILPLIREIQSAGPSSFRGIASALNDRGIPSPRGGRWQATSVQRLLTRVRERPS
jgi:DNA invertase Pin-like site-specific DNA recombinase